jgi:hypothetical protein
MGEWLALLGQAHRLNEKATPLAERARFLTPAQKIDLATLQAKRDQLGMKLNAIHPPGNVYGGEIVRARAWGDLYFLWSLQRTALVYDLRTVGGKDWYAWGASLLVAAQHSDGCWADAFPGVPDTCFALLFLKRANLTDDLTGKLQQLGPIRDPGPRNGPNRPAGSRNPSPGG